MNELTVKLLDTGTALPPVQWNKEEVETWLEEQVGRYRGRAYNPEDMKDAKKDRAAVNKIEKDLAAAQKEVQDRYNAPVVAFLADMKRMRSIAKEISGDIDVQIKRAEEAERDQRREQLEETFRENVGNELAELLSFGRILDSKWLNKSVPLSTARRFMLARLESVRAGMDDLRSMCGDDFPDVQRAYLRSLNLNEAISEYRRIQEVRQAQARAEAARKAAQEAAAAAPIIQQPTEEQRQAKEDGRKLADSSRCITPSGRLDMSEIREQVETAAPTFTRTLTVTYTAEQGKALVKFLKASGIAYELG